MKKETKTSAAQLVAAVVFAVGVVAFTRGVWLAWRPGGWMVAGIAVGAPALFWLYNDVRTSKDR